MLHGTSVRSVEVSLLLCFCLDSSRLSNSLRIHSVTVSHPAIRPISVAYHCGCMGYCIGLYHYENATLGVSKVWKLVYFSVFIYTHRDYPAVISFTILHCFSSCYVIFVSLGYNIPLKGYIGSVKEWKLLFCYYLAYSDRDYPTVSS